MKRGISWMNEFGHAVCARTSDGNDNQKMITEEGCGRSFCEAVRRDIIGEEGRSRSLGDSDRWRKNDTTRVFQTTSATT